MGEKEVEREGGRERQTVRQLAVNFLYLILIQAITLSFHLFSSATNYVTGSRN